MACRQFQQAQRVGHHGAALADFGGDFLLRELKLLGQLRVAVRFFDGVEIFALEIFDERQFEHRAVVGLADDDGHFRQLQQLRGAPAAFAGNQFKITVAFAHDERLHDALFADGIGQFAQRFGGKILARLERAGTNAVERHALHAFARVGRGCGSRSRGRWNGAARAQLEPGPDCRPATRRGRVPKQVLPCAQSVAGQGTCQREALGGNVLI